MTILCQSIFTNRNAVSTVMTNFGAIKTIENNRIIAKIESEIKLRVCLHEVAYTEIALKQSTVYDNVVLVRENSKEFKSLQHLNQKYPAKKFYKLFGGAHAKPCDKKHRFCVGKVFYLHRIANIIAKLSI